MRILVTGGAGYIGSVTAQTLLDAGHEVTVLDDLRTGHRAAVPDGAAFELGDVADRRLVGDVLDRHEVGAVVHFAASSQVGESMARPHAYFANNTVASLRLLEAAHAHGVDRFVLSSTAAVYGAPDRVPIPESADVRPESVYGETKATIERALDWFGRTDGLGWCALRYFNAAGATERYGEDHRPETHLIPLVLEAAEGRRAKVFVFGDDWPTPDGTPVRDYVHVQDLADAHVRAVESIRPGTGAAYNVGAGRGASVQEVIDACRAATGRRIVAEIAPRRAGDPAELVADPSRIRDELGWVPSRSDLDEIVESAWAWRRAHPDGYERA